MRTSVKREKSSRNPGSFSGFLISPSDNVLGFWASPGSPRPELEKHFIDDRAGRIL